MNHKPKSNHLLMRDERFNSEVMIFDVLMLLYIATVEIKDGFKEASKQEKE